MISLESVKNVWAGPSVQEFVQEFKKSWALPPNIITYFRLVGMVFPGLFFLSGHMWDWNIWFLNTPSRWLWAAPAFYALVMLTDVLDGWMARKFHWESELGAMLDPIADKGLVILTLIMVCVLKLWIYLPLILIVLREVEVTRLRIKAKKRLGVTVAANRGGKNKAVAQNVAVLALLMPIGGWQWFAVSLTLLTIAVALSIHSWIKYDEQVNERLRSA
ncbi:MAG: CDP-alcohol phosphatidyltransferase family protein [Candidatus Saccharibacteria bacterium]|nr:CDP-alcohol phosphatidyltransferase family protein [Candidatus Saccharibacteria bacterium]